MEKEKGVKEFETRKGRRGKEKYGKGWKEWAGVKGG